MLSQGVPMLRAGDEISQTKDGNNNTYCQDNDISWINWQRANTGLLHFTREVIHWRRKHPIFCRRRWFRGRLIKEINVKDIEWFLPDGREMTEENWKSGFAKSLAIYLNGADLGMTGFLGEKVTDDNFYIIFNADGGPINYTLPPKKYGDKWIEVINTKNSKLTEHGKKYNPGDTVTAEGRTVVLLQSPKT